VEGRTPVDRAWTHFGDPIETAPDGPDQVGHLLFVPSRMRVDCVTNREARLWQGSRRIKSYQLPYYAACWP
jgi:hypothetical protein